MFDVASYVVLGFECEQKFTAKKKALTLLGRQVLPN